MRVGKLVPFWRTGESQNHYFPLFSMKKPYLCCVKTARKFHLSAERSPSTYRALTEHLLRLNSSFFLWEENQALRLIAHHF